MTTTGFDSKFISSLNKLNDCRRVGVAVSGGADSVSLLNAVVRNRAYFSFICCVTVNHNLREEAETSGDAEFVQKMCQNLNIECDRYDVSRGLILERAAIEKKGIEDAARFERYQIFYQFIEKHKLDYLFLAHNKNDFIETVLMRFFQGSSSSGGISFCRGKIARPLLFISRSEIEEYLSEINVSYRTDSTNSDNSYFRNNLRNRIIPVLKKYIPGFENSLLLHAKKSSYDSELADYVVEIAKKQIKWSYEDNIITFEKDSFLQLPISVRIKVVLYTMTTIGCDRRVNFSFIEAFCFKPQKNSAFGIEIDVTGNEIVFFKAVKAKNIATETGFFAIIEETVRCKIGSDFLDCYYGENGVVLEYKGCVIELEKLNFPFAFRSVQAADRVQTSTRQMKSCFDILSDWKCGELKNSIPIIEQLGKNRSLLCIWGSVYDFENWIV